ncbi:esterase [Kitasatospora sp. NPDC058046]|uniref:esterase n=1 Tax=Kitasatospora sp. NPDC058046 TaxID=3346312 RepID=UPI0036D81023
MPPWASGALVHSVPAHTGHPIKVLWIPHTAPQLPFGRILLRWEPAPEAGWDVTARLGLATTVVPLATWPAAGDDWPHLIHPTLREVTGLCSALLVATAALELANRLADS